MLTKSLGFEFVTPNGRKLNEKGELVSLVGPNGVGKSTLLRAVIGWVIWEKGIKNMGITLLLVEQEISAVFAMADRNYVL